MKHVRGLVGGGLGLLALSCSACSGDFDLNRSTPPRGSLGRELYSLVCDRVGAQALREDVTGSSYHGICHPDPATGQYVAKVDASKLVPLDPNALDVDGHPVDIARQQRNRAYRIARIETLGRRREDLVGAFDAALPDIRIAIKDLTNPDPTKSCAAPQAPGVSGENGLRTEVSQTLGRMVDLYNDRTIPLLTESLAHLLDSVERSPDTQSALAKIDARQGYRPNSVALGIPRPALSYPRLVDLANALLKVVSTDSDPFNPAGAIDPSKPLTPDNRKPIPGKASAQLQQLLHVLHEELRTSAASSALPAYDDSTIDANDPTRKIPSRARGSLELTRHIVFQEADAFSGGRPTALVVLRDGRGVAQVPAIVAPFVDATGGPGNTPDGVPDLDDLGRFVTSNGAPVPSPFFSVDGADGKRDPLGRALGTSGPLYKYLDTSRTFLAAAVHDVQPLLSTDASPKREALMNLAAGLPVLFGSRDASASAIKQYAPDPQLSDDYKLMNKAPPPGLATAPVVLPYRSFHPEDSPLVDLVHAIGQVLADPTTDDTLSLFRQLLVDHPKELARLIGVGLQIKAIADKHPEAHIPAGSTFWDEMLDVFVQIAQVQDNIGHGGILEDLITAFGTDETLAVRDAFTAYIDYKDELTYNPSDLNGTAFNLTTGNVSPMMTPVDRSQPDTGTNRSALQRFMQLLHDANGLAACTKDGAIAHVNIVWPQPNGIPISLDYPTNPIAKLACAFLGSSAPTKLQQCGVLRFENVAAMLLDVALDRAQLDIRDDCLKKLVANPTLTGIVGGADAFLEEISGIKGFNLYHPTVSGVARMVYYDTPHDNDPGDASNPKTEAFFRDVMDPVASMVCPLTPFVDPTDGKTLNIHKCASFDDTLRGRDNNALFPLEQLGFIKNVRPLAAAFEDHHQPLYFVNLFDTMHRHWGSAAQPKTVCDPTLPKTDARWCSQDGAVTYEALLSEALKTDLFPALHDIVPIVQSIKVQHCSAQDPKTHVCTEQVTYDGVKVLAEAVRGLIDPARAKAVGLTDRHGSVSVTRNDGTSNPQVTPMYLLIDALKGMDRAFDEDAANNGGKTARHDGWHAARSQLVDTFLAIDGSGKSSDWSNKSVETILPVLVDTIREQLTAHCPEARISGDCAWARADLTKNVSDVVGGPMFAAVLDLVDALRADDAARTELEKFLQFLLASADGDAQQATVTAAHDILQLLEDDANLTPLLHSVAEAAGETLVDDTGKVVRRSLVDAVVELLSRVLARATDAGGNEICAKEIDPNRALATILGKLVTPMADNAPSPIEVMIDVTADVNRVHPEVVGASGPPAKLDAGDYANIAAEVSDFCTNKERGLEQVYEVIREATL